MIREEIRSLLDRLDSVASNTSLTIEYDLERAIDIMESLRDKGYPTAELVERYGSSPSEYILVSLAFVVARHAGEGVGSAETSPAFLLAEKLAGVDQPTALTGCLSALHRGMILGERASAVLPPPASELVVRALEYSGDQDWIVYTAGLNLVQGLCSRDTLRSSFSEGQIESLKRSIARIRDLKTVNLREDADAVLECLRGDMTRFK
jgi:hypothetical protein